MQSQAHPLDQIFQALSDPTRRAVIERLSCGFCATSELAKPFTMALPSFTQHLDVLERCGLVMSRKRGRVRTWELKRETLAATGTAARYDVQNTAFAQLNSLLGAPGGGSGR